MLFRYLNKQQLIALCKRVARRMFTPVDEVTLNDDCILERESNFLLCSEELVGKVVNISDK